MIAKFKHATYQWPKCFWLSKIYHDRFFYIVYYGSDLFFSLKKYIFTVIWHLFSGIMAQEVANKSVSFLDTLSLLDIDIHCEVSVVHMGYRHAFEVHRRAEASKKARCCYPQYWMPWFLCKCASDLLFHCACLRSY